MRDVFYPVSPRADPAFSNQVPPQEKRVFLYKHLITHLPEKKIVAARCLFKIWMHGIEQDNFPDTSAEIDRL